MFKNALPFAAIYICFIHQPPVLQADVIFARVGQDLTVEIDQVYSFDVTADANRSSYGIIFHDVYSVDNNHTVLETPAVRTSRMEIDSVLDATSAAYGDWGQLEFEFNDIDANDLWGLYTFGGNRIMHIGDEVSITAGIVTVDGFFNDPNAILPDQSTAVLQLTDDIGQALSAGPLGAAVPEPASVVMLSAFVGGLFVMRRKKNRSEAKPYHTTDTGHPVVKEY